MRKISLFAALVVAMGAVSCVQDINDGKSPVAGDGKVTFEASFGAVGKALLEPGAAESKVAWEKGDQVSVLAGEANYLFTAASAGYTTTLDTEDAGVPAEGTYYGLYPYDDAASLAGGVIATSLPAEQTAVQGSFSTHMAVAQAVEGSMFFKNVCGLVKVTIDAENVTKIVFEGNSGEVVAGGINVTVSDTPSWEAVAEQGETSVALVPAVGQSTLSTGAYYFAVLPQTFSAGFKVTAYKGDKASVIRNVTKEYTLARADIMGGKAFGIAGAGTETDPYILKTAQDMVDMRSLATYGGETWFKMANDIDMTGVTNYIPVNYDDNYERKIHFDGGNFTISNFTYSKAVNGANYGSLFGVLYGSCKNLKVDKASVTVNGTGGVIGGYVGADGKPAIVENVTITNSSVVSSASSTGGVAGVAREGSFKNVSYQGTVTCTLESGDAITGGFVGRTLEDITCEGCSVNATVTAKATRIGGFVGRVESGSLTLSGCSVAGSVTGTEFVGGLVGRSDGTLSISKSYTTCHVKASADKCGGLVGANAALCEIENSYSTSTIENTKRMNGGLVGFAAAEISIMNSYATGNVGNGQGSAGILGNSQASAEMTSVVGCIAWNEKIETASRATSNYAPGAIVGSCYYIGTFKNCWRRLDMTLTDGASASVLSDMDDCVNAQLPLPEGVDGNHNRSYHGKSAAEDATVSSVAAAIGWDETIWDLSTAFPTLR